jgi:high-affinity iron transporter
MHWADAVPNLVIGLREGLEAGLIVSILLAAVRKSGSGSTAPIWLGVLGAVSVAGSFAAVLTFSTSALPARAQEAVGGSLSVIAVALVTGMIFWMRRAAAGLAGQLRSEVARATIIGAGALAITAFLAVGREGLETTLFIWTAVKASGTTVAPLVGAALGLAAAITLCCLLYRQAVRLNLGVFFSRTALALVVIAAGVLSYGLGDLQEAGWLSGRSWVAFDLTAHVDTGSWWVSLISGVTDLTPRMTVLQVVAWVVYLAVVIPAFVRAGARSAVAPNVVAPAPSSTGLSQRWERLVGDRTRRVAVVLVAVPAVVAGLAIALLPSAGAEASTSVTVTGHSCAANWHAARSGRQTIRVDNKSGKVAEINVLDVRGGVVGEIETLGPATTAPMTVSLGTGSYTIACLLAGQPTLHSGSVTVTGGAPAAAVVPVTLAELSGPNDAYQRYAAGVLDQLAADVTRLRADLAAGDLASARRDWLAAQLDWERVGASYDSFGDAGVAVDGLPDAFAGGVNDPDFTGLHRVEYGLWHGQSAAELSAVAAKLAAEVSAVRTNLGSDDIAGDPTNLPLRAHEILEDALRDHLSGIDDQGAGAAYEMTDADVTATRAVLSELAAPITSRAPGLLAQADAQLDALHAALLATSSDGRWRASSDVPLAARQAVNAAIGAALEALAPIPELLEVPPSR